MKSLLIKLFVENWARKLISLILAIVIWLFINHSMTVTKTVHNISVQVTHLPPDKTIEGMQPNGFLDRKVSLVITGNKSALEHLSGSDLSVAIDASGKGDEWAATIDKRNLVVKSPNLDLSMISSVTPYEILLRQSRLVTEKIPILVTRPIGEAPKGYQFLDVWPYQLSQTVKGPESAVKEIKARGCKLTFNLSDISAGQLHAISKGDEVSYFVPDAWKKVSILECSDLPIEIDDPEAKNLRIDFFRQDLLPLDAPIPVVVFFPPKFSSTLNPETYKIALNDFIEKKNGMKMIAMPLHVKGVSRLFLETVKDMIQVAIIAEPKSERETLSWHVQFLQAQELEDRYVAKAMAEAQDVREEFLRNRFRNYANTFRLYMPNGSKLGLKIELQASAISISASNQEK